MRPWRHGKIARSFGLLYTSEYRRQPDRYGDTMRAIRCNQYGPPESLVVENLPDLEPPPGHVGTDGKAAAVNFPDVLIIENKYQFKPPLPFTPGSEVAGVVRAVGAGVTQFKPGSRVVAFTGS